MFTLAKFRATTSAILQRNTPSLLALVTLGGTTQIGSFIFTSRCPRWPRQVQCRTVTVACRCRVSLSQFRLTRYSQTLDQPKKLAGNKHSNLLQQHSPWRKKLECLFPKEFIQVSLIFLSKVTSTITMEPYKSLHFDSLMFLSKVSQLILVHFNLLNLNSLIRKQ